MGVNYATLSDAELRNENEEVPDGGISETAEEQLSRHHEIHLTDATRGNDIAFNNTLPREEIVDVVQLFVVT